MWAKLKWIYVLLLLALIPVLTTKASSIDPNFGEEYMIAFGRNAKGVTNVTLSISGRGHSAFRFTNHYSGQVNLYSLQQGGMLEISIDPSIILDDITAQNKSVLIESNCTLIINGFIQFLDTAPTAFTAVHRPQADVEYLAIQYLPSHQSGNANTFIYVIAYENNTHVSIDVNMYRMRRPYLDDDFYGLNRGQVYMYLIDADISGSVIAADGPIAVFSGSQCSEVPYYVDEDCHMLLLSVPPMNQMGHSFYLKALEPTNFKDTVRVIATADNTIVWLDGKMTDFLHKGDFSELEIQQFDLLFLNTSKPCVVAQYKECDDLHHGNPVVFIVPPVRSYKTEYTVTIPHNLNLITNHCLMIFSEVLSNLQNISVNNHILSYNKTLLNNYSNGAMAFFNLNLAWPRGGTLLTITSEADVGLIQMGHKTNTSLVYSLTGSGSFDNHTRCGLEETLSTTEPATTSSSLSTTPPTTSTTTTPTTTSTISTPTTTSTITTPTTTSTITTPTTTSTITTPTTTSTISTPTTTSTITTPTTTSTITTPTTTSTITTPTTTSTITTPTTTSTITTPTTTSTITTPTTTSTITTPTTTSTITTPTTTSTITTPTTTTSTTTTPTTISTTTTPTTTSTTTPTTTPTTTSSTTTPTTATSTTTTPTTISTTTTPIRSNTTTPTTSITTPTTSKATSTTTTPTTATSTTTTPTTISTTTTPTTSTATPTTSITKPTTPTLTSTTTTPTTTSTTTTPTTTSTTTTPTTSTTTTPATTSTTTPTTSTTTPPTTGTAARSTTTSGETTIPSKPPSLDYPESTADPGPILVVNVECAATTNQTTSSGMTTSRIWILTDFPHPKFTAHCKDDFIGHFATQNFVNWYLDVFFTGNSSRQCLFKSKNGSQVYTLKITRAKGDKFGQVIKHYEDYLVTCTYDPYAALVNTTKIKITDSWNHPPKHVGENLGETAVSDVVLTVQDARGDEIIGNIPISRKVRLHGEINGTSSEQGVKALTCVGISSTRTVPIIVGLCGNGVLFEKHEGFFTRGLQVFSPYFKPMRMNFEKDLKFMCNFTICTQNCDGRNCVPTTTGVPTTATTGVPTTPCPVVYCSSVYDPVCGSDVLTYENMCALERAMCRNPSLQFVKKGIC